MSQSNTRSGDIPMIAGEDLTNKDDRVVKITNDGGVAKAILPNAVTDRCAYLVVHGNASGKEVTLRPLSGERNVRVPLVGACNPGDSLVLATIDGAGDGGVMALPAAPGTYAQVGIAEEIGVDGQLVLLRPDRQSITVN